MSSRKHLNLWVTNYLAVMAYVSWHSRQVLTNCLENVTQNRSKKATFSSFSPLSCVAFWGLHSLCVPSLLIRLGILYQPCMPHHRKKPPHLSQFRSNVNSAKLWYHNPSRRLHSSLFLCAGAILASLHCLACLSNCRSTARVQKYRGIFQRWHVLEGTTSPRRNKGKTLELWRLRSSEVGLP